MTEQLHRVSPSQYIPEALLEIEGGKRVLFQGEGSGLQTWEDNFEDLGTLEAYEQLFIKTKTRPKAYPSLSSVVSLAPSGKGLIFDRNVFEVYTIMALGIWRDSKDIGRIIDSVHILEMNFKGFATIGGQQFGVCPAVMAGVPLCNAILITSSTAGSAAPTKVSNGIAIEHLFPETSEVCHEEDLTHDESPGTTTELKVWIMGSCIGDQFYGSIWLKDPISGGFGTTSQLTPHGIGVNLSPMGMNAGSARDAGFFLGEIEEGTEIVKYTAIPLSWR